MKLKKGELCAYDTNQHALPASMLPPPRPSARQAPLPAHAPTVALCEFDAALRCGVLRLLRERARIVPTAGARTSTCSTWAAAKPFENANHVCLRVLHTQRSTLVQVSVDVCPAETYPAASSRGQTARRGALPLASGVAAPGVTSTASAVAFWIQI